MTQTASKRSKPLVLHIDDSQTVALMAQAMLEELGLDCLHSPEGLEGLALARRELPDLILLDAMMPGLDGFETCRRLKSDPATKAIPVLMLTGTDDPRDAERIRAAGADGSLIKPLQKNLLKAELEARLTLPVHHGGHHDRA